MRPRRAKDTPTGPETSAPVAGLLHLVLVLEGTKVVHNTGLFLGTGMRFLVPCNRRRCSQIQPAVMLWLIAVPGTSSHKVVKAAPRQDV